MSKFSPDLLHAQYRLQDAAVLCHTAWTLANVDQDSAAASYRRMAEDQLRAGAAYLGFELVEKPAAPAAVTTEVAA